MDFDLTVESTRSEMLLTRVKVGMRRHAEAATPWEDYSDLTVVARTAEGTVAGAAFGEAGRGWLHLSVVWVDEAHRGFGVGRKLVAAVEAEGHRQGCANAYLDSFSYQAPGFYEKLGYEIFGVLEDYPLGHQRFYMRKTLGPS
jgi:ribosomal protein S18 acetylase RimI-like enzyme